MVNLNVTLIQSNIFGVMLEHVCVCVLVYVIYKDTKLYNDMGMTCTSLRWSMRTSLEFKMLKSKLTGSFDVQNLGFSIGFR